jgi:hypothetical protein
MHTRLEVSQDLGMPWTGLLRWPKADPDSRLREGEGIL